MLQLSDEQLTDLAVTLLRCCHDRRAVRALIRVAGAERLLIATIGVLISTVGAERLAELIQDAGDE